MPGTNVNSVVSGTAETSPNAIVANTVVPGTNVDSVVSGTAELAVVSGTTEGLSVTLLLMSKLALHAILTAADGKAAELEAAVTALVAASEEEDGLEVYAAAVDSNNPNQIHFFEIYADEAALGVHGSGDGMKAAMGAVGGLLEGGPVITMLRPFAGKGVAV